MSWLALALLPGLAFGQGSQVMRDTLLVPGPDTLNLKQPVPGSCLIYSLDGQPLDSLTFDLYPASGLLVRTGFWPAGSYVLVYRSFSQPILPGLSLRPMPKDTFRYAPDYIFYVQDSSNSGQRQLWETDRIRKSGSLTRGVTVGNNRSLSLNSGLRLQLEGDLGDGMSIVGAISDDNIPIQPDGSTQQLSDFDRIFIRVQKNGYFGTIGDYEIEQKGSRFADLYRNVQGLQLGWKQGNSQVMVSGAVAKGKFHSNSFEGIDGVSGPYRLSGRNGERFFIVLAGSERVYLNGQLLVRGEDRDYIINYNTAEVTFTSAHVITNITRIVVDFEYNDQYYNRSLMVARAEHQAGDLQIRFSYARDADNQNAPFNNDQAFALVRDTLSQVGDVTGQVVTPGIFELGWDNLALRYEAVDTTVNGLTYPIYRYSRDSTKAIYSLFFSFVGEGKGDYEPDRSGINANVYTWVPPDAAGRSRGSYAPQRSWVLPRLLQVADTRLDYQLTKHLRLSSETALSFEDRNRLSDLGDDDNLGLAQRTALTWDRLRIGDSLFWSGQVAQQFIARRFENLDRVYQAEYNRIWDLAPDEARVNEQIYEARTSLVAPGKGSLQLEGGLRADGEGNLAQRQIITVESQLRRMLQGRYTLTRITRDSPGQASQWLRQEGDLFLPLGNWRPGVVLWLENKTAADSLRGRFRFQDWKPYLRFDSERFDLEMSFNYRQDEAWLAGAIRPKSLATTSYLRLQYEPGPALQIQQVTAFRRLDVQDSLFRSQGLEDSRTLNTNWQLSLLPKRRWIMSNLVYEVTSEQLARQEVRYLQVNPGQGQYVWLDSLFNNDGIQDIGEFQLANNPLIADFVRVLVPTRDFAPTTRLSLSGSLRLDFKELVPATKHWAPSLARATRLNTTLRITQNKTRGEDLSAYWVSWGNWSADSSLLNANYALRQDLTFFQNSPKGDLRFAWLDNQSVLFLTTGQELRQTSYWGFAQRLNLSDSRSLENDIRIGRRNLDTEQFPERNFAIPYFEWKPQFNVQWNRNIRLSGTYVLKDNRSLGSDGMVQARVWQHRIGMDNRFNLGQRNNLFVKAELVRLIQQGNPPAAAAFEMKEGLEPGWNGIWQVFFTWYFLQNLEFSVTYDGRAAAGQNVIHTGRVQVRAFF